MTPVVHHLENSRSQRILWLLEELGVGYELKRYERDKKTMLGPESLRALHPLGKSPLLEDKGRVVAESANIVEYILDEYGQGRLRPSSEHEDFHRYRFWLHYAEGSLMPLMLLALVIGRVRDAPVPFLVKPIAKGIAGKVHEGFIGPQTKLHLSYVEAELAGSGWFCGDDLSAADIQMSFPLEAASTRLDLSPYPNIKAFVERIHARPAYQKALERGGPYAYA